MINLQRERDTVTESHYVMGNITSRQRGGVEVSELVSGGGNISHFIFVFRNKMFTPARPTGILPSRGISSVPTS